MRKGVHEKRENEKNGILFWGMLKGLPFDESGINLKDRIEKVSGTGYSSSS